MGVERWLFLRQLPQLIKLWAADQLQKVTQIMPGFSVDKKTKKKGCIGHRKMQAILIFCGQTGALAFRSYSQKIYLAGFPQVCSLKATLISNKRRNAHHGSYHTHTQKSWLCGGNSVFCVLAWNLCHKRMQNGSSTIFNFNWLFKNHDWWNHDCDTHKSAYNLVCWMAAKFDPIMGMSPTVSFFGTISSFS